MRTVEEPPLPVPEYQPPSTGRRVRRRYRSKMSEAKPVSGLFYHVPVGTRYYSSVEDIGRTPSGRQNGRARLLLEIDPKGKYYPILDQYKGKDGSIQPLNIGGKETRLIYVVLGSKIILVCLLPRSKEYKNLENYLSKIQT